MTGKYSFAPWAREGAATAVSTQDGPGVPARAQVPVTLTVNGVAVPVPVTLNGPGDVTGLDATQVVRTEPRAWTQGFEPNYFPAVEFDRPDLPWLFTPLAANGDGRLRPWLALVVVRKQDGVTLLPPTSGSLPVLHIGLPAVSRDELPDLADSWAWAHVQTVGSLAAPDALADLQRDHPERTLSRLVCPRRLAPSTVYHACVVPTFEAGRQAGLGEEVTATDLTPAWDSGDDAVELPVFHHWEFGTGEAGDFESLVRLLKARPVPASVGYRDMFVGEAGFGLPEFGPDMAGAVLAMEGALRAPQNDPKPWPDPVREPFQEVLGGLLDTPETQLAASGGDPIVAPPIYARWHAATPTVQGAAAEWVRELNLDPRHRAASALGTRVVQGQQEALMASAWEQVGDVLRANRALREAQFARSVGFATLGKHLAPMSAELLVASTAPAHTRLLLAPMTLHGEVAASALPSGAVSAVFRRIVRASSPLRRRFPQAQGPQSLLARLNVGDVLARPEWTLPVGAVTASWATATLWGQNPPPGPLPASGQPTAAMLAKAPVPTDFTLPTEGDTRPPFGPDVTANFRDAAVRHLEATGKLRDVAARPTPPPLALDDVQPTLLGLLDPAVTIPSRVGARIETAGVTTVYDDPIEPIMAYPVFPQPMYEPLRDLSPDLLVPGIDLVAPNTVTLLATNPRFIESYLLGLNHEMARELLWREYPTDQRGSCFRQFWDVRGSGADQKDIAEIHTWKKSYGIGENLAGPDGDSKLVLLIRGELLRRYPNTIIYAVPAVPGPNGTKALGTDELYPAFRGTLPPDVTFLGFDLTEEQALGEDEDDLGYFFVLQEPVTEPRFGLDVATSGFGTQPATWSDLSWAHLVAKEEDLATLTHAPATWPWPKQAANRGGRVWGENAAHLAAITMQQPMRVAVAAAAMITQGT